MTRRYSRSTILVESFQSPELSPGGRQIILEMVGALLAGVVEERGEAVEPGHVGLDRQLGIYRGLEVQHGSVGVLCDPLENLVPEQ